MNKNTLKCPNCGAVGSSESKGKFDLKNSSKVAYRFKCVCGHKYLIYGDSLPSTIIFNSIIAITEFEYKILKEGDFF